MSDQAHSAYSGRWVARIHGHIVAQGGTPEQALRAAQHTRHKEKPEILYMPLPLPTHPLLEKIRSLLTDTETYLVGGAVRDLLLNRLSPDLDFVVPSQSISTARKIANTLQAGFMILDKERDTARVIVTDPEGGRTFLDFTSWRGNSLEEDLRHRDFTINAIAFHLQTQTLYDPLNGAHDLRARWIRSCAPTCFSDDPLRILRAVRQAAELDFKIEPATRQAMKAAASLLPLVSPERQRDELFKILAGPKPDSALRALEMLGILPHLLPELCAMKGVPQSEPHVYDVWEHTLSTLHHLEGLLATLRLGYSAEETNDLLTGLLTLRLGRFREGFAAHFARPLNADRPVRAALFFAALYHDVEKPATRSVDEAGRIRFFDHENRGAETASRRARALNLSNDEIKRIETIVRHHMRFHSFASRLANDGQQPSRKAIYRFFRDTAEAGIDLVLLGLADVRGTYAATLRQETWSAALDVARLLLENYWEKPHETVAPPRLLDGHELMQALNLPPGKIIGQILEAIREQQASGKIFTREQALEFAREWQPPHTDEPT
jgi:tRNA nucleotidyltransferase/poly(A) polymerase